MSSPRNPLRFDSLSAANARYIRRSTKQRPKESECTQHPEGGSTRFSSDRKVFQVDDEIHCVILAVNKYSEEPDKYGEDGSDPFDFYGGSSHSKNMRWYRQCDYFGNQPYSACPQNDHFEQEHLQRYADGANCSWHHRHEEEEEGEYFGYGDFLDSDEDSYHVPHPGNDSQMINIMAMNISQTVLWIIMIQNDAESESKCVNVCLYLNLKGDSANWPKK